jgi:hypothetical protein
MKINRKKKSCALLWLWGSAKLRADDRKWRMIHRTTNAKEGEREIFIDTHTHTNAVEYRQKTKKMMKWEENKNYQKKSCAREIPQPRRGEYKLCWFTHTHERKKSREMRDTRKGNQLSPAEEKKKNKDVKVFPALLLSSISSSSSSWNSICSYPNSDMMTSVQWGEGFHNSKWENSRRRDSERESLQKIFIHARRNMCRRRLYTVWLCARKKKHH